MKHSKKKASPSSAPYGVDPVYWARLQKMRLLDDLLLRKTLEDNIPAVQIILRILLKKPDLIVKRIQTQRVLENPFGKSLILDALATDADRRECNIEVQRQSSGAKPKRARYHASLLDVHLLPRGKKVKFDSLPETYILMITEEDYFQAGKPLYHIDRKIEETGNAFGDEAHIIYVNGAYTGSDEIGQLMADFRAETPEDMHIPELADRVFSLKRSQKGVSTMYDALDETYQEGFDEGRKAEKKKIARRMLKAGVGDLQFIADVSGLPLRKIERIQAKAALKH